MQQVEGTTRSAESSRGKIFPFAERSVYGEGRCVLDLPIFLRVVMPLESPVLNMCKISDMLKAWIKVFVVKTVHPMSLYLE